MMAASDVTTVTDKKQRSPTANLLYSAAKRSLDVLLLVVIAPFAGVLALLICIAVWLDSPGKVFFTQQRHGKDGVPFKLYKFRTMHTRFCDNGGKQAKTKDKRITWSGKWLRLTRLDELPQLWNIAKGDMSFIGPRPHPVPLDHQYADQLSNYWLRYSVKPGLTGLAQIHGCMGNTPQLDDMQKRVEFDLIYAAKASIIVDLAILFRTVKAVFNSGTYKA